MQSQLHRDNYILIDRLAIIDEQMKEYQGHLEKLLSCTLLVNYLKKY